MGQSAFRAGLAGAFLTPRVRQHPVEVRVLAASKVLCVSAQRT